jgi:hypothetical protein
MLNTLFVYLMAAVALIFVHNQTTVKYIHYFCAFSYIAYIYLVFEESISKKFFAMFSIWMFSLIALLVAAPFAGLFDHIVGADNVHYVAKFVRNCLQGMQLAAVWFWINRYYKSVLNVVSDRIVGFMALYPVIGFFLLASNYTVAFGLVKNSGSTFEMLFFLAFVVLGYVLVFVGISSASQMISLQFDVQIKTRDLSERKRITIEQERIISELQEAVSQVKELSGLLPICASCKRIRNDEGYWEQLETYISHHSKADFSHAICPECAQMLYPEYSKKG